VDQIDQSKRHINISPTRPLSRTASLTCLPARPYTNTDQPPTPPPNKKTKQNKTKNENQSGAELSQFLASEKELVSQADGNTVIFAPNVENQPRARKTKKGGADAPLSSMLNMLNRMAA
jgi:hypothetical protein